MEKTIEKINKIKECKFCLDTNNQEVMISPCYCIGFIRICEYFYKYELKIKYI